MQQICLCWLDGELGSGPTPEEVASLGLPVFPSDEGGERSTPAREAVKQAVELAAGKKAQGQYRNSDEGSPFILGEALPVVPGKLVLKIQRGEYVDMAELLKDNVEAERRRLAAGESGKMSRSSRREVPDMESWLQCFSSYAAVVCAKYPQKAQDLWAYQAFIIAEHRKCGGRGWLLYDSAFRQQISLAEANFAKVNQGLYATTFLALWRQGSSLQSVHGIRSLSG